jgi:hypothetical protein
MDDFDDPFDEQPVWTLILRVIFQPFVHRPEGSAGIVHGEENKITWQTSGDLPCFFFAPPFSDFLMGS